ncbi:Ig-like domain-containing protein [Escherichia coli]
MQQTPSRSIVADEGSNPIDDHTVTFAVLSGSATCFNNQNTAKTDVNGLATFDLKSSKQEDNTVEVTLENGVKQTLIVSFVGDSSTAQVDPGSRKMKWSLTAMIAPQ